MFRPHLCFVFLALGAFGILSHQPGMVQAEDFRVDNAIYEGDRKEPTSESITIFHGGIVYDCIKSPTEIVVFDDIADRFILLNPSRRERAELTSTELATFVDQLQKLALKSKDPVVQFLAEPKFQERIDDTTGDLILSSPLVNYRVALSPQSNKGIVEQYHEFCDYYARLNALLSPGSRPPFGRLVVNAALAQRQATASQVQLTIRSEKGTNQQTMVRSEHQLVTPLELGDIERVAKIREQLDTFKKVSFDQYRKGWAR
jgi:hypothetical protein